MTWQQICEDPNLRNLPYKIESNERGQLIMSPTRVVHGFFQSEIGSLLRDLTEQGKVISECAIQTAKGTKVADVAWCSPRCWEIIKTVYDTPIAPEICVEVRSPSNSDEEMEEKRRLYFEKGAQEVWVCDEQGDLRFFSSKGELSNSNLVPSFPHHIEL